MYIKYKGANLMLRGRDFYDLLPLDPPLQTQSFDFKCKRRLFKQQ